jgi:hypothetical protein
MRYLYSRRLSSLKYGHPFLRRYFLIIYRQ